MLAVDKKFSKNKFQYLSQCVLATLAIAHVFLLLDIRENAAVIASLGASSFIAFAMPHAQSSRPRFLIGGYIVGVLTGTVFYLLGKLAVQVGINLSDAILISMLAATAVGTSIFAMTVLNFEHPPAAGLALGLVINEWSFKTVVVVVIGVAFISGLKALLRPALKNLL